MVTFQKNYFGLAIVLLITEILIALFVRDQFVRPYLGDVLVVILLYCAIQSFIKIPVRTLSVWVLAFAFAIEGLQYFKFVNWL